MGATGQTAATTNRAAGGTAGAAGRPRLQLKANAPMSTTAQAPARPAGPREITIVSHSNLFYWWPVWAVGFLMALITLIGEHLMATVPRGTQHGVKASGTLTFSVPLKGNERDRDTLDEQDVLIAPKGKSLPDPRLHMSPSKNLGVIYVIVLLLVVTITNVPLRGLWSVIVLVVLIFLVIIFALMGVWDTILTYLSFLDIRINMGGYLFVSTVLFVLWLVVFVFFDPQIYMVFTPGQLRVRLEIGEGETAYDTTGMTIQKQRSDLFRHWILGLGSGDLIVRTAGAQAHHFDLPNVLFLGRKVKEIEEMLRSRPVVAGHTS